MIVYYYLFEVEHILNLDEEQSELLKKEYKQDYNLIERYYEKVEL